MKIKLVVSDFHLGKGKTLAEGSGNLLEDFQEDRRFIEFLKYYSSGEFEKAEVELVINGDFLNLLQIDINEKFPEKITEAVAVAKTRSILKGHHDLFAAMERFAAGPSRSITYIVGNHDPGLLWQGVRDLLRERLGEDLRFPTFSYRFDGVHIEHGQQHEAANRFDPNMLFLFRKIPEPILNLPWGSQFVIRVINEIKKERHYVDKIKPFRAYIKWAIVFDFRFALRAIVRTFLFFFRNRFMKSRWRFSKFRDTLEIIRELTSYLSLEKVARNLLDDVGCRIVIFGHTHQHMHVRYPDGKEYLNTGTWNQSISLNIDTLGRNEKLTYVMIDCEADPPTARLKEWKGQYHITGDL